MRYYCTLSDKNYLIKGLALLESLKSLSSEQYLIYYLCMDDYTYDSINALTELNVKAINISSLNDDEDFLTLKSNTEYVPEDFCTYCFALGSFISEYLTRTEKLDSIMYIDSDIVFHQDPKLIFETISNKSIGIILHRHVPIGHHCGGYNVGVVYFRNDDVGYKCLKWWRDCVMDPNNEWFAQYGRVGDQVYLEGFEPLFGESNICVIDTGIGHGAPWNFALYQYEGEDIIWNGNRQKMVFSHFSHFTPDYVNNTYSVDRGGEWGGLRLNTPEIVSYYDNYFISLKNAKKKYGL
jgi:hypothetical protein